MKLYSMDLNNKYDMPFDKTYIITNAELPETKEISMINKKILDSISKVIDGIINNIIWGGWM